VRVHPLTADRWPDLLRLFGDRGATNGCWCMFWRLKRGEFEGNGNRGNRSALEELVRGGAVPGVLGYRGGVPVGWCSIAPREQYGSLERSPKYRRLDDAPVWSVVCFFLDREHRDEHLGVPLLKSAVDYAWKQGAEIVEGYPSTGSGHYMGTEGMFERAGFRRAQRIDDKRSLYRLHAPR
jgi:hypothetical protein